MTNFPHLSLIKYNQDNHSTDWLFHFDLELVNRWLFTCTTSYAELTLQDNKFTGLKKISVGFAVGKYSLVVLGGQFPNFCLRRRD
jgi:hypothetical protein